MLLTAAGPQYRILQMKSIYLYDSALRLVKAIENSGYLNIHTLATQSHYVNDQKLITDENLFLKDTVFLHNSTEVDFPQEKVSLDYDIIEKFRPTQYRVEQYMLRLDIEQYKIQYIYYQVLSYFYRRFKNGVIDAVITVLPLHGSPLEMIPIDLALHFNKPVITFDKLYANPDGYVLWGIWNYHKKEYLDISSLNISPNLNDYLFYKTKRAYLDSGKPLYKPSISQLSGLGKISFVLKNLAKKDDAKLKATINSLMGQFPRIGFYYLRLTNKTIRYNSREL